MAILTDMRRKLLRRKHPVTIDVPNGEQAGDGSPLALIETKPTRRDGRQQQEEVLGMISRIGDHLDAQTERTVRLIELLEELPRSLDVLPEINRQNTRLLDVLTDHLDQVRGREDTMNAALNRLGEATTTQTRMLGQVQEQLEVSCRLSGNMTDTLGSFRETLTQLSDTNTNSVGVLSHISTSMEKRETDLTTVIDRSQRWTTVALIACTLVAGAAVVVSVLALLA